MQPHRIIIEKIGGLIDPNLHLWKDFMVAP